MSTLTDIENDWSNFAPGSLYCFGRKHSLMTNGHRFSND